MRFTINLISSLEEAKWYDAEYKLTKCFISSNVNDNGSGWANVWTY